jgi:NTE family protein
MEYRFLRSIAASALSIVAAALVPAGALSADAADASKPAAAAKRPKTCLVLSGGGARGAAHVGVIKVLEELRVPIDCIAGTSMGALVGAAYATGMSVAEMEKLVAGMSVEMLFKEKPPRQEMTMRRKFDDYFNFVGPEIGVGAGGAVIGKGVISGVQLETVLRQLAKVPGYHRFDDLPIPFRAVATDLVTGKAVVFDEGEIANVMRASMSVPGAVAPAEFGGMMLVDGMLTSNLPVEVARAMGADIVIAVNVGTPLLKREELTSIIGVANQMLSILTEQNVQASLASLKPADVLISPELGDFSTGDFDNLPKITPLGEAAARKVVDRLAQLSIPADDYAALRKRQQVAVPADVRPVDEIRFDNLQRVNPQTAQAVMQTQPRQPIDQTALDGDMRRLYGIGDFEHVNYRILDTPGNRVLSVEAVEKAWGPDYLRLGIGLSSDFTGQTFFDLVASYRKTWLNSLGAEWRSDVQLGSNLSLRSEFYQPLNVAGSVFIAPSVYAESRQANIFSGGERIAVYDIATGLAGVDLGFQGTYGVTRLGIVGGTVRQTLDTGPDYLQPTDSRVKQAAVMASLKLDQIDSVRFPRSGWLGDLRIFASSRDLGADLTYTRWSASARAAYTFGEHTINLGMNAGGKIGSEPLPGYDQFQWGGFLRQSGFATGQLMGGSLQYAQLMYFHRIYRGGLLEGAYGGFSLEAGKVGTPLVPGSPDGLLKSMSVFVAADSFVGPVYLGYGRAQAGPSSFYFYLGRPY